MEANETSLTNFLEKNDTQFVIPVYQRNYDWTDLQCKELLDDILRVGSDKDLSAHFIGSIVYIHDDVYSTKKPCLLTIIDGQQRLTTITLVWIVLYREAKKLEGGKLLNEIYEKYLTNKFLEGDAKLKLRPTSNNDKALQYLLNDDGTEYGEYSRLVKNFSYFRKKINEKNLKVVMAGIAKLRFVEISLERGKDDPQRIFESLNSTGLDLSQGDLIRNYILMGLEPERQKKTYEDYWRDIEILATDNTKDESNISDFIRHFIMFKFKEMPNEKKVYQKFKSKYSFDESKPLEETMVEIKRFAQYYNKIINPDKEDDRQIREQFRLIYALKMTVSYPFILKVYHDYATGVIVKETLLQVLELIQSFVWRRFIMGLGTNSLNQVFMYLCEDVVDSDYVTSISDSLLEKKGRQKFPKDDETIDALRNTDISKIQYEKKRYLLERLENYNNNEPVKIEGNPDITIEHIFPRTPDPQWITDLGEEEYNKIKATYVDTIGNLTLSGNNGALSNKSFIEKRDLPEKGYKASRLFLNKHLSSLEKWDVEEIDKRFNIIEDRFKKIWQYPTSGVNEENNSDKNNSDKGTNVFAIEDPTGKKIDYFIFLGKKHEVSSYNKIYEKVLFSLFEMEPEIFFSTDLGEKLKLSKSDENHHRPLKISETYFVESNINAKNIVSKIQYALKTFERVDDLYIKFKQ